MASEKIFFSYSRTDSTFVLQLAKDLRDAGITLWLDQLDIKAGSHWDSSIQDALVATRILVVILSKASVKSENVMDEVSFALEQDKTIIPIIINDCTPPFRLMRLQRLDFISDYQTGLNQLLETINQLSAGIEVPGIDPLAGKSSQTGNSETADTGQEQNKISADTDKKDKELERLVWETAKKAHTLNAYKHYIGEFPNGRYKDAALAEISRLENFEKNEETTYPTGARETTGDHTGKSNSKKYILLGVGALLIAAAAWGIMQYSKNSEKEMAGISKKRDDSIQLAQSLKVTEDSLNNVKQAAMATARKDSIKIGNEFRGGIIYYIDASGEHGLIMAPGDQSKKIPWFERKIEKTGAFGRQIYSGRKNTNTIVGLLGEGNYPAKICSDFTWEGYDDWYLPSKDELDELYKYSKKNKGFTDDYYWSSTELADDDVYYKSFYSGQAFTKFGSNRAKVRAIRSF